MTHLKLQKLQKCDITQQHIDTTTVSSLNNLQDLDLDCSAASSLVQ